ncbi:MAG: peptide MFS transporter, partial [Proteobacteria bacterium]|nr:peptide MFS transporter [Pseudomonadota bacterium]
MDLVFVAGILITVATAIPVVLQLRSHPRGLFVLFFAEMWERFSYYGMRGLLIFYLTQQFLFDDTFSQGQYGAYTSLVYLLPLIGGMLADRFLGTRKAILFGAVLLVAGHLAMGIEGKPAVQTLTWQGAKYEFQVTGRGEGRHVQLKVGQGAYDFAPAPGGGLALKGLPAGSPLPSVLPKGGYQLGVEKRDPLFTDILYLALSLIIVGVGFLKANISSIVGQLYPQGDPRRDPGFTLYYYGINLGAFWASIACGWLGQNVGWWAGFGAAGVGMLAGLVVFVWGKPLLEGHGEPPDPVALKAPKVGPLSTEALIYLGGLAAIAVVWMLVQNNAVVGYLLGAGSVAVLGYLGWFMATSCTKVERERLFLALVLIAASVVFWTLFEQAGSSLNQFAERNTDLGIGFGQAMTAAQTQSFNAGFILLGAPVFSALWAWLGRRGADPNPVLKFALGLLQVGAGFFVLVWGAAYADAAYKVPLVFLAAAYLLHTTGELCLSPVGLSQMTKLSAPAVISTIMATWFLASSWAQFIGGKVAQLTATETVGGQVLDPAKALATYTQVFAMIGWAGLAAGVLMLVLSPLLKGWAHGASDTHPRPEIDGDRQGAEPA